MSNGKDGNSPTSTNFLSGMLGSISPFEELFKMVGMELPDYLKGTKNGSENKSAPIELKEATIETTTKKPDTKEEK